MKGWLKLPKRRMDEICKIPTDPHATLKKTNFIEHLLPNISVKIPKGLNYLQNKITMRVLEKAILKIVIFPHPFQTIFKGYV